MASESSLYMIGIHLAAQAVDELASNVSAERALHVDNTLVPHQAQHVYPLHSLHLGSFLLFSSFLSMSSSASRFLTYRCSLSYDSLCSSLPSVVSAHHYGVLHTYNLTNILHSKGQTQFDRKVSVFEVCNPGHAARILTGNLSISNLLPCRIVVFQDPEQSDAVIIQAVKPSELLGLFGANPDGSVHEAASVATQVESDMVKILEAAAKLTEPIAPAAAAPANKP